MSDKSHNETIGDQFHVDDGRDRTITSREAERLALEEAMLKFLGDGGAVQKIDKDIRNDPPRRPESNYGSRPI